MRITVKKQSDLGIKPSDYNVYSYNRQIDYCTTADVAQVVNGNLQLICPVANWRCTFSTQLKKEIGLPLGNKGYDDKEIDTTGQLNGQNLACFIQTGSCGYGLKDAMDTIEKLIGKDIDEQ